MRRKSLLLVFTILSLLSLFTKSLLTQSGNSTTLELSPPVKNDTVKSILKLPKPYRKKTTFLYQSPITASLRTWAFYHRKKIWSEIQIPEERKILDPTGTAPNIDWSLSYPARNIFELDYRESSLYVPTEVRDYVEFKMGRERYIPLGTLAAAAYLGRMLYQKYGYLLREREKNKYRGIRLNDLQLKMMRVLWEYQEIPAVNWYQLFTKMFPRYQTTFTLFLQEINNLDNKFLLKQKVVARNEVKYFPALSVVELKQKLRDESFKLDGLKHHNRLQEINSLIEELNKVK